jgi:signal transduction histidine kinase
MNERTARWLMALAGVGGCLLVALAETSFGGGFSPRLGTGSYYGPDRFSPLAPTVATVLGLCLLRWWPYLMVAGGLLCVPFVWPQVRGDGWDTTEFWVLTSAFPFLVIGALAAAQSLFSAGAPGLGAVVAGLTAGAVVFGRAVPQPMYRGMADSLSTWRVVLLVAGFVAVVPALWWWRGDRSAVRFPDGKAWGWKRVRLVVVGGAVALVALPFALISADRIAEVLNVGTYALHTNSTIRYAISGGLTLVAAVLLTLPAGLWPVGAALTAATVQIGISAPLMVGSLASSEANSTRWWSVGIGVVIGAAAVTTRWRVVGAVALTLATAVCVFIGNYATTGEPQKLIDQKRVIPAAVIILLVAAATTAVVGATAPVLAQRGAIPAVLGPVTGVIVVAGVQTTRVIDVSGDGPLAAARGSWHFDTAAALLLAATAAIGGLGAAHYLSERWAERKRAELIRQEAAAAERDRLARPIHDGVLQVLALVQKEGSELGSSGAQLAALAGEQEAALRNLLSGTVTAPRATAQGDLRAALTGLTSATIEVSAPGDPVVLPTTTATELIAAVQAALDNIRQHAGPDARTWILLEDEGDGVRVTVRDDGVGFEPDRLAEAARSGRLGVEQSMRGRIRDLGGVTAIKSRPGRGTEVEFWVPRRG